MLNRYTLLKLTTAIAFFFFLLLITPLVTKNGLVQTVFAICEDGSGAQDGGAELVPPPVEAPPVDATTPYVDKDGKWWVDETDEHGCKKQVEYDANGPTGYFLGGCDGSETGS